MTSRLALTAALALGFALSARAAVADSGLTSGLVARPSQVGVRGSIDAGLLSLAGERYADPGGHPRYRAELALRLPVRLSHQLTVEPQVGILPLDYQSRADGRAFALSASATVRFVCRILGPLSLVIDPVRTEYRLLEVVVPENPMDARVDRSRHWALATFIGLQLAL